MCVGRAAQSEGWRVTARTTKGQGWPAQASRPAASSGWPLQLAPSAHHHALCPLCRVLPRGLYLEMIKLLLAERMPLKTRRARLVDLVHKQLAEPLTEALNERVDVSMLPERAECKVMRKVVERLLEEIVDWSVAEVDERVSEELAEGSRGRRRSSDCD